MQPSEYNKLLAGIRISNVVLRSCFASTARANFSTRSAASPDVETTVGWKLAEPRAADVGDPTFHFTQQYTATFRDEGSGDVLYLVTASYELGVTGPELTESFAEEFAERQLTFFTRPYFREFLSSMAPRSLIDAPAIGTQIIPARVEATEPTSGSG